MIILLAVLACGAHHARFPLLGAGEGWTYGPSTTVEGVAHFVRIDEAGWLQTASTGGRGASTLEFTTVTRMVGVPKSAPTFGEFDESKAVDEWIFVGTLDSSWYVSVHDVAEGEQSPWMTLIGRDETCAEAPGIGSVGLLVPWSSGPIATARCAHSGAWLAHAWVMGKRKETPRGSWAGDPHLPVLSLSVPPEGVSPPAPVVAGGRPWVAVVEARSGGWQVSAHSLESDASVLRIDASSQAGERVWLGHAVSSGDGFLLPIVTSDASHKGATVCITRFTPARATATELACHPFEGDLIEGLIAPVRLGEVAGRTLFAWSTQEGAGVVACDEQSCGAVTGAGRPWRGCSLSAVAELPRAEALLWDCPASWGTTTVLRRVRVEDPDSGP